MDLSKIDTRAGSNFDKEATKLNTQELVVEMGKLQRIMYAQSKYSLLIILQGLDASGKDGAISKIFSGLNPFGYKVYAFKAPTEIELSHDFLWRVHPHAPSKGIVQVFNRSHYEDVLVPKVEGYVDAKTIKDRYQQINMFEQLLQGNGTQVLKFYLHISPEEQQERLTERLTDPTKFWKHNDQDWQTAKKWNSYRSAYHAIFKNCNQIPWHVIPSDQNWYKEHLIAKKIVDTFKEMDLKFPENPNS